MVAKVIAELQKEALKADVTSFRIGDTVNVHVRILEGDKERIQVFTGTVIAVKGTSSTRNFTVRRISHGVGVERIFPMHSPYLDKIEVESSARTRRSKLYFLRRRVGKQTRLREQVR